MLTMTWPYTVQVFVIAIYSEWTRAGSTLLILNNLTEMAHYHYRGLFLESVMKVGPELPYP